jgi:hypothetical protein
VITTDDVTFRAGDWVEVRSREEILATLDKQGRVDKLPFMPEMLQHCGQRFQVFKSAHKTCDPPSGLQARRMTTAVHLTGIRCGGEAHGGCQAGCLIFWKQQWLKKVDVVEPASQVPRASGGCTEQDVVAAVHRMPPGPGDEPLYSCQSTDLFVATAPLPWWQLWQYVDDLRSRNVRVSQMVAALMFFVYHEITQAGIGLGSAMRWTYDLFQRIRGGTHYPWRPGCIPKGMRTPSAKLDLQVGEAVRVRPYKEILDTLDQDCRNRGMYFDGELVPFCNGTYQVQSRVERIIDEKTGKMTRLKNDAIILKDVACEARYAKCRRFCSRSIYPYWREIWLERAK